MSGLIYSRTDSGLLVAENGSGDERAVARALRDYDPDLRLVPQGVAGGRMAYKVYRYCGSERPAEFICFWGNERGEPYPLSHRLLDKVRSLDKNQRGSEDYRSEDELNEQAKAARERQAEEDAQALLDDWKTREGRSALLPRGPSLARARARTGYHDSR